MTSLTVAIIAHLIADILLQNAWMAQNKSNLAHSAAWVHSGIHLFLMSLIFPLPTALLIAFTHLLIDTKKPLKWWNRVFLKGQPSCALGIAQDQTAHMAVLVFAFWSTQFHIFPL